MKDEPPKFEFKTQLANGSVTKKIADFSNVKELYQKLAEAFEIQRNEVNPIFIKSCQHIVYTVCSSRMTKEP
jgi:hypothetical protein